MKIEELKNTLTSTKDMPLNLSNILTEEDSSDLNLTQRYSIILACAYATKNKILIATLLEEISPYLSQEAIAGAKAAAVIMAMNNIYYRFIHLLSDKSFSGIPPKLRMTVIANPGIAKDDFEFNCLAVSAINGCGMCMDAHTNVLLKAGVSKIAIQTAVRIAAVIHAVAAELTMNDFTQ